MELCVESSQAEFDSHLYNTHGISDNSITIAAARTAAKARVPATIYLPRGGCGRPQRAVTYPGLSGAPPLRK